MNKATSLVLIILVHWATTIVAQCAFNIRLWFHDYSTWNLLLWTLAGVILAYIDYRLCTQFAMKGGSSTHWVVHLLDLLLAFPSLLVWGSCFFEDIADGMTHVYSSYEIVWIVGIILVDACFVTERIRLIRKK